MNVSSTMPVFISPAAMAKLGHPLGEINLTRAAGNCGIVQAVSFRLLVLETTVNSKKKRVLTVPKGSLGTQVVAWRRYLTRKRRVRGLFSALRIAVVLRCV